MTTATYPSASATTYAMWLLSGSKTETGGLGHDLIQALGNERYGATVQGLIGMYSDGGDTLQIITPNAVDLALTGNIIGHCIVVSNEYNSTHIQHLFGHESQGRGDTGAPTSNAMFNLRIGDSTDQGMHLRYFHEAQPGGTDINLNNQQYGLIRGVPYHLGFARIDNEVKFYMNGRALGTASAITAPDYGGGTPTGFFYVAGPTADRAFKGTISSVKIVTGSDVTDFTNADAYFETEYSATFGGHLGFGRLGTNLSPVAYFPFNGDLLDYSGNDLHLTLSAGTERYTDLSPGFRGFLFDGVTNLIRGSSDTELAVTGNLTVEFVTNLAWMNPGDLYATVCFMGATDGTTADNTLWRFAFNDTPRNPQYFSEYDAGANEVFLDTSLACLAGRLQHWVMVRENNVVRFYLNGTGSASSSSIANTPNGGSNSVLVVGDNHPSRLSRPHEGALSELKIFDRALSDSEITAEYERFLGIT